MSLKDFDSASFPHISTKDSQIEINDATETRKNIKFRMWLHRSRLVRLWF